MILLNKLSINKCVNNIKFATLGPYGTSSEFVTKKLCTQIQCNLSNIKLFDTYEQALENVKNGTSNVLLVANAYYGINNFYMDNEVELLATFIENTPQYGIASRYDFDLSFIENKSVIKIASHPAPIKKLDNFNYGIFENKTFNIKFFDSTSAAAKSVKNEEFDFCLTNAQAVDMYNLKFVSDLTNISMVWSIFGRFDMLASFALVKTIYKRKLK